MVRIARATFQRLRSVADTLQLAIGSETQTQGWLRAVRHHKHVVFGSLNDGLSPHHLQVIFNADQQTNKLRSQCFVQLTGRLAESPGRGQTVELQCCHLHRLHNVDSQAEEMPQLLTALSPARVDDSDAQWQEWRSLAPFRARWPPFAALMRARAGLVRLLQRHLDGEQFVHVHTPVLTGCDCEGAGEVFSVSTSSRRSSENQSAAAADAAYFGSAVHLSVSGQLHLEALASGIARVYCLGPAFRAERSRTKRHLAEFFMLEAELAAVDSCRQLCDHVQQLLVAVVQQFLEQHRADLQLIHSHQKLAALETRLQKLIAQPFARLTYTEAVEKLSAAAAAAGSCEPPQPGEDLRREHELLLTCLCGDIPVFVTHWPSHLKPFYMKRLHSHWVDCVDLLMPDIGELVGGSVREHCPDQLLRNMTEAGRGGHGAPSSAHMQWYTQLRRYGCPPSGGYGLGVERLLMLVAGLSSVRDTLPFPRWYQHCSG